MKTEMEKCLAGEWYDCHAPVFLELKGKTHRLLMRYNSLSYEQKEEKYGTKVLPMNFTFSISMSPFAIPCMVEPQSYVLDTVQPSTRLFEHGRLSDAQNSKPLTRRTQWA